MLQVAEEVKRLYQADSIEKNLTAEFRRRGETVPYLTIYDNTAFADMKMTESLTSSKNLDFGSCEATQISLTVSGIDANVKGTEMTVYQTLDGSGLNPGADISPAGYTVPLGKYIVQSADRQTNRKYRDLVALDYMCLFDVNVIDWYNALPFPLPLRDFRARLCGHIGVSEYVPEYLPNDDMMIDKTVEAEELMGRDVLTACEQLNGVFGHFDRLGVLRHITLPPDTQPCTERITMDLCIGFRVEEYTVQSIDKVQIRQEEGDIGAIYGTGSNCLTVEGNFLAFGKSAEELNRTAMGIYGMVNGRSYPPYSCEMKGLPYFEVGDRTAVETAQGDIAVYIIKRTLKGISALKDSCGATGEEIRSTEHNVNTEIIQLKGKSAVLKKSIGEVSLNLTDLEKKANSKFEQFSDAIRLKVDIGDVSSQLSLEEGEVRITGNRLIVDSDNFKLSADIAIFSGLIKGAEIDIRRGKNIGIKAADGKVQLGDFVVADAYGRQILQSTDERTGLSGEPDTEGKFYLWAGYRSDSDYAFAVNNRKQTHTYQLYCHDDDAFYQGRTVTDMLKEIYRQNAEERIAITVKDTGGSVSRTPKICAYTIIEEEGG